MATKQYKATREFRLNSSQSIECSQEKTLCQDKFCSISESVSRSIYSVTQENEKRTSSKECSNDDISLLVNQCSTQAVASGDEGFHSLAFINKKLNEENKTCLTHANSLQCNSLIGEDSSKHAGGGFSDKTLQKQGNSSQDYVQAIFGQQFADYLSRYALEVHALISDYYSSTSEMICLGNYKQLSLPNTSLEELVVKLRERVIDDSQSDIFSFSLTRSSFASTLRLVFEKVTGKPLIVGQNETICMWLDLENEEDREFLTAVGDIKFPTIDTIIIDNFYEGDEELETFLSQSISSVNNLILRADGYCVDFHDYCEKLQELDFIKCLYLKGFLIDSEDLEQVLKFPDLEKVVFESCKIEVDEHFCICEDNELENRLVLKSLHFIRDEMEEEDMKRLAESIKQSSCEYSFESITVLNCALSQEQIDSIFN
ncbi:unnamed protein product [Moneuplotes crassus]|uniref:Uncharacterized protein n=1 Tax=Euplotes crassus TaxID=5936 RepID=A0AAD1TZ49_EUPCR|nr:unnamed protein product [Moneuplotes crassus]